jgi:2-polyprenyl-6-methoxyphenol hydroxylase-like FAD-dependent oxidoreductase
LATALQRQGFAPELIERGAAWPSLGAGINLPANGPRVLRLLGLGEVVAAASAVISHWGFFGQQAEPLCLTDLETLWQEVGPCLGIERTELQAALLTGAASVPSRLGVAITSLAQDGTRAYAGLSDGTSREYDLVVGADGISSTVRALVVSPVRASYAGQVAWRSVIATRPSGVTGVMVLLGDGCFFGLVPVGSGRTYGFGAVDAERLDDPLPGRLARFRDRFADFGGPVPAYLAALEQDEQLHFGPIEWVELDHWHQGRVVLIGDAAHAAPPHMGEGGCMAMEDAFVLAEVLRAVDTVEDALEIYIERRRPRVGWVQDQSRAAARAWVLPVEVRNAALRERGDQMFQDRYRPLIPPP